MCNTISATKMVLADSRRANKQKKKKLKCGKVITMLSSTWKKKKKGIRLDLCIKLKSGIQEGVDKLY